MKTSNKILIIAYALVIITLSAMVFVTRPLVERAIIGSENSYLVR